MPIDEQKIISDFNKSSSGLKDYKSLLNFEKEYRFKKQQRKLMFVSIIFVFYLLMALTLLLFFRNKASSILFWPLNTVESQRIESLENRLQNLEKDIENVQLTFSSTTNGNSSLSYINSQIHNLNTRQESIEQSINLDPEKALTATLLREKQKNLENNFIEIKNSQAKLESKFDNFITTIILGPLITAILGFIIWLIQSRLKKEN